MSFEEHGISHEEERRMERDALEGVIAEQGADVIDNDAVMATLIEVTNADPGIIDKIYEAAHEIAQKHGISDERAAIMLAERAIEKFRESKGGEQ